MKKKMKKILSLCLILVLAFSFASCSGGPFSNAPQYKEDENGFGLYRYKSTSTETEFTVPDEADGKAVTQLMSFSLANAEYLVKLNIGKNIKYIDEWALTNCLNLEEINVDPQNPNFCSVDGVLYTKDKSTLLCYPNSKSPIQKDENGNYVSGGEYTVLPTVKEIRSNAFYLCDKLYKVNLNEGLEKIGNKAFIKCTNLSEINLPSTLTELGVDSFSYCDSVKSLEIPSSVTKIGDYAFYSTASNIDKIVIHQDSEDALELGEDWIPNRANSVQEKVPVEYVGIN